MHFIRQFYDAPDAGVIVKIQDTIISLIEELPQIPLHQSSVSQILSLAKSSPKFDKKTILHVFLRQIHKISKKMKEIRNPLYDIWMNKLHQTSLVFDFQDFQKSAQI